MTTTERVEHPANNYGQTGGPSLVPPPKLRRRPLLLVGGIAAICLGALIAVWAWTATTDTHTVLAARVTIHRGDVIAAADITQVQVGTDPSLSPLPGSAYSTVLGQRASLDISAGTLLTSAAVSGQPMPPPGESIVGISLTPAQIPGLALNGGARVRIVLTPGQNTTPSSGAPVLMTATLVDTHLNPANGNTVVDVLVSYADAPALASRAATGNVALVLDSGAP